MVADAPTISPELTQSQIAVDEVWGGSIKQFRIDTTDKDWLTQVATNLQAITSAFQGSRQQVKVSFDARYPQGNGQVNTTSRTQIEIATNFESGARSQSLDQVYQDAYLFPTDALNYVDRVVSILKGRFLDEKVPNLEGYESTRDIVVIPGKSDYFSESLALGEKKNQILEMLQDLTAFCESKLDTSAESAELPPEVLSKFKQFIKENPLDSWDEEIPELGGLAGIKALALAFTTADISADAAKSVQIAGKNISVLELKHIFDLFQRTIHTDIVTPSKYEYDNKSYSATSQLSGPEIATITNEEFSFRVLDDAGDALAQLGGNTEILSAGGGDQDKIRAFLAFYGSGDKGQGDVNTKTKADDTSDKTEVVKKLRGKIVKAATSVAAIEPESSEDGGGDTPQEEPKNQNLERPLTLEQVVDETTAALATKLYESLNFAAALDGKANPKLLEQLIKENLQRLITLAVADELSTFLQIPANRSDFYDETAGTFYANPTYLKWQANVVAESLSVVLNRITGGSNTVAFVADQVESAEQLASTFTGETPPPADLEIGVIPANLDQLVEIYKRDHARDGEFNLAELDTNWTAMDWESRKKIFANVERQSTLLTDTAVLSALASYGLTSVEITQLQLNPNSRLLIEQEIKNAFGNLTATEWLAINSSATIPVGIYAKIMGRVVPRLTADGSDFDTQLYLFLSKQLIQTGSSENLRQVLTEFGVSPAQIGDLPTDQLRELFSQLQNEAEQVSRDYAASLGTRQLAEIYERKNFAEFNTLLKMRVQAPARDFSLALLSSAREGVMSKITALGVRLDPDGHLAVTEALVTVLGAESLAFLDVATRGQLQEILGIPLNSLSDAEYKELISYLHEYLTLNLQRRLALLQKPTTPFLPFSASDLANADTAITRANLRALGRGHQGFGDDFTLATQLSEEEIAKLDLSQEKNDAVQQLRLELFKNAVLNAKGEPVDFIDYGFSEEDAQRLDLPYLSSVSLASLSNYQAQLAGVDQVLPVAGQTKGALGRFSQRIGLGKKAPKVLFNKAATAALSTALPGYSGVYKAGEMLIGKENMQRLQMALIYGGVGGMATTALAIAGSSIAQLGFTIGSAVGSIIPGVGTVVGGIGGAWGALALEKGLTSNAAAGAGAGTAGVGATGSGATTGGLFSNLGVGTAIGAGTGGVALAGVATILVVQSAFLHELDITPQAGEVSKYVEISKTASPSQIENSTPTTITYTVTISPKEGYVITPKKVSDTFSLLGGKDAVKPVGITSPRDGDLSAPLDQPISAPTTLTYSIADVSGVDVLVNNLFTLEFEVNDPESGVVTDKLTAIGSLRIGNPAIGCFEFAPANSPFKNLMSKAWQPSEIAQVQEAFARRAANSTLYLSLLCNAGPITLYRLDGETFGGWAPSSEEGRVLGLYDLGLMYSVESTEYTFLHELGHIIDYRNPGLRTGPSGFNSIWSGDCYTYPAGPDNPCSDMEGFAEAMVLFVVGPTYQFEGFGGLYNLQQRNPQEYNWMKENIFGIDLN